MSFTALSLVNATMPESFYTAMGMMSNTEVICVKNNEAGASITEAYENFEYLNKETQIASRTHDNTEDCGEDCRERPILEASINSDVIGQAHLGWRTTGSINENNAHYTLYGGNAEDLTGVFSIEKFFQLWSNSTMGNGIGLNWLACP